LLGSLFVVEQTGLYVEAFRRDLEGTGELLKYLSGRSFETSLDLTEVRVRHTCELGKPAYRELRLVSLLTNETAEYGRSGFSSHL